MVQPRAGQGAVQIALRLPANLRDRLREAAERSGRSMNSEIVSQLEQFFELDDFFNGNHSLSSYKQMVEGRGRTSLVEHIIRIALNERDSQNTSSSAAPAATDGLSGANASLTELILKQQRMIEELLDTVKSQGSIIDQLVPPKQVPGDDES